MLDEGNHNDKLRSEAAEAGVLSILMAFPDSYDAVAESLKPALFTVPNYRALFVAVRRQIAAAKHPDVVTMSRTQRVMQR